MFEKLRHQLLGRWAGLVSRHPWWIVGLALLLTAASVVVAVRNLRFESDRNALISPDLPFNRRYLQWIETFPGSNDVYVAVDTYNADGEPDPQAEARAQRLVEQLGEALGQSPAVEQVEWGFNLADVAPKTLRLAPPDQFEAQLEQIDQAQLLLASESMAAFFQRATQQMYERIGAANGQPQIEPQQVEFFIGLMDGLQRRLATDADEPVDLLGPVFQEQAGWEYLKTPNGRLLLIRITPVAEPGALNPFDSAIESIRVFIDQFREQFPGVEFGLTGISVIESDETVAVERDTMYASIGAALAIGVLLVIAFHSLRLPLIMMTALGVAIAWSFGYTTLAVGHLQVISVVFAVILLGLGVAFAIHLASRFERVRHQFPDNWQGMRSALVDTFEVMGPGVTTGAVTTAAAFATTMFTDFLGVAEMGQIAAVGVLLCLVAMFSVFAALLRIFKPEHKHTVRMEQRFVHFYEDRWVRPFWQRPWWTLGGAAAVFIASLWAIQHLRFDYNLLALLPRDLPSVQWQQRIARQGEQSIYTAVSTVNSLEEAADMAERFGALPTVESVGGIGELVPPYADEHSRRVDQLRRRIEQTQPTPLPRPPQPLMSQLASMAFGLQGFLSNIENQQTRDRLESVLNAIQDVLDEAQRLTPGRLEARLDAMQSDFERLQQSLRAELAPVLDPSRITVEDLSPAALRPYFVDTPEGRRYVLEINPNTPTGIDDPLDPRFLGRFVRSIESVDPNVTGVIVQVFHSGDLILRSYVKAGLLAMVIVFVLVWIDFRSIVDAAATLVPVAVGFAATFGVMQLFGESINPANIIVLPLMFGIGVDDGVHIIHRYRQDRDTRPLGLSGGTGKGIALTSYTTMIGFGALIFASHRGIAGLGLVLTVGIGMTLLACWTIMPAWLELRSRRQQRRRTTDAEPEAAW